MALVGPGALTEYTGGPRHRQCRGFVSVREPAQGFFVTGSVIDALNGIYARVQPDAVWSAQEILLAYRHDQSGWLMVLAEYSGGPVPEAVFRREDSDSDAEDEHDELREWLFIDTQARHRFVHKGDTIIPGGGVAWQHLHRGCAPVNQRVKGRGCGDSGNSLAVSVDSDEEMYVAGSVGTDLQEQHPDDEDELPWQVIAILDRQTMCDMRYTQQCYDENIKATMSAANIPRAWHSIEYDWKPGCWNYHVRAQHGVAVHALPAHNAPVVGFLDIGEVVQGVETRGPWLRLLRDDRQEKFEALESEEGAWAPLEDSMGTAQLIIVAEEDSPIIDIELPDAPDDNIFDRPFEPRLEDSNGQGETVEYGDKDGEEDEEVPACCVPVSACGEDGHEPIALPLPEEELVMGTEVMLEGLSNAAYNGQSGTVVTRRTPSGRQGVRLHGSGERFSVREVSLRPVLSGEGGPLARHARILGLTLSMLGLGSGDGKQVAISDAEELLSAALRATQRDLPLDADSAQSDAYIAYDMLGIALAARRPEPGMLPEDATDAQSPNRTVPKTPFEIVESGALGARAAEAARLAGSTESLMKVEEGVAALRQLVTDENRRLRRASRRVSVSSAGALESEGSPDELRLRLTLVRALLRCRREAEAAAEAQVATRFYPTAAAAMLLHGRCLLRVGKHDEGLSALAMVLAMSSSAVGVDGYWAVLDARWRLQAMHQADHFERRAKDAYARGLFADAASLYGEAISSSMTVGDAKWARAELYANRASCHRRAREFQRAVEDLDVALGLFPRYKRALFRRGVCLLEAGVAEKAVDSLEGLLVLDRAWPNLCEWLVRAHALKRRGVPTGPGTGQQFSQRFVPGASVNDNRRWAQAPEEQDVATERDHYAVLGVPSDATEKQLKRAYRIMSLKFHPDKEGGSTRAFQRIAVAYETLSDPQKRRSYDEGADLKTGHGDNSDSDSDREHQSLREEIERKYFPERYKFWPFGDPFVQKRRLQERRRKRSGRPAFHEQDV